MDAYILETENFNYLAQGRSVLFSAVSVVEDFAVKKSFVSILAKVWISAKTYLEKF